MRYPNFIIGGAAKAGTTTLYKILRQHPQVFLSSIKEPQYFSSVIDKNDRASGKPAYNGPPSIRDKNEYLRLFSEVSNEVAVGEASTIYLHHSEACRRIAEEIPEVKLIFILRNPVDRAYSQYLHHIRDGRETCQSFEEALKLEEKRKENDWGPFWTYKYSGLYYKQLYPYYELFPREQIKVIIFEEFLKQKLKVINELLEFLNIEKEVRLNLDIKSNSTGYPKLKFLNNIFNNPFLLGIYRGSKKYIPSYLTEKILLIRSVNLSKRELDENLRKKLWAFYQDDIKKLERLLKRDLNIWDNPS